MSFVLRTHYNTLQKIVSAIWVGDRNLG